MEPITEKTVEHLAKLAHLELRDEEKPVFARHLGQILEYANSLSALPIDAVPPMSHAAAVESLREDTPGAELRRDEALAQAPDPDSGLFRVPRIIG